MACHRRFADGAGFTCHCWECAHATGWHEERTFERMRATCDVDGRRVSKYDSPNNGSSTACECCGYETRQAMTMTNDERREVAARLRRAGRDLSVLDLDCEAACHVADGIIGCDEEDDWEFVFSRLADLVDPTCEDVSEPPRSGGFWPSPHFKCSVCGASHVSTDYVRFCPNCGARVVSDDRE